MVASKIVGMTWQQSNGAVKRILTSASVLSTVIEWKLVSAAWSESFDNYHVLMRTIPYLTMQLARTTIVLLMIGVTAQLTAQPVQFNAEIVYLKGQARFRTVSEGTWNPAKVGDVLKPGTMVQTGTEKSKVDLLLGTERILTPQPTSATGTMTEGASRPEFSKANVVRILENSLLRIDKLTTQTNSFAALEEIHLNLLAGKMIGDVKRLSVASKYEIELPIGIVGVRGPILYFLAAYGFADLFETSYVHTWTGDARRSGIVFAYKGADGIVITQVFQPNDVTKRFGPIPGRFFCE
jgi:hypothetical protein